MEKCTILSIIIVFLTFLTLSVAQDENTSTDSSTVSTNTTVSSDTNNATVVSSSSSSLTSSLTSPLQSMIINTRKPALSLPMTVLVFQIGKFTPSFNSCTLESPLNSTDCYQDDIYNDRLTFQLTFKDDPASIKASLTSRPPEVITSDSAKSIASPTIASSDDVNNTQFVDGHNPNTMFITVIYNCKSNQNGIVPIKLTLHLGNATTSTDDTSNDIAIHWQKSCANGFNDKMKFGYLTGHEDAGTAELHTFGKDTAALVTVGASDESTEFFIKLEQPGASQAFLAPFITSTFSDILSINIRGNHPQGGIIEGLSLTKFQVGYECHRKGEATIEATIGIPPFQNISAVWKKDCGGNPASHIQVGSQENAFDIVDNGEATPRYMVGIESIGTAHSAEHMHLPENVTDWTFFVKNGDDPSNAEEADAAMIIGRITATIEKPTVIHPLSPRIMTRTSMTWRTSTSSSFSLHAGDSLKVDMPLICRSIGESRVLITIPILGYKELEFGVAKECSHVGIALESSEFVLTVSSLFWIVVSVVLLACVVLVCYRRSRASKGEAFSPLPRFEQNT